MSARDALSDLRNALSESPTMQELLDRASLIAEAKPSWTLHDWDVGLRCLLATPQGRFLEYLAERERA